MAIQTVQFNPSTANPGTYDYEPVAYQPPPPAGNVNGKVVLRSRFKEFAVKSVYHCHTLPMKTPA